MLQVEANKLYFRQQEKYPPRMLMKREDFTEPIRRTRINTVDAPAFIKTIRTLQPDQLKQLRAEFKNYYAEETIHNLASLQKFQELLLELVFFQKMLFDFVFIAKFLEIC